MYLIDFQASNEVNLSYKFLLVYQDHLTKFIVLRPLKRKTAEEVVRTLMDIFCLIGFRISYKVIMVGSLRISILPP